jgi:hypothetical protein
LPFQAALASVMEKRGDTITVEFARQGGKNELSAVLEAYLLYRYHDKSLEAIKCAPTVRPQLRVSMRRLMSRLRVAHLDELPRQDENTISVGQARIVFLSAEPTANVVGHTASLLMEVDEAQAVDEEKFDRDFLPMTATTNATIVMYGTPWDDRTLLERAKQRNLELERRDGRRRHFSFDWQYIARRNPAYALRIESERVRLGENHPTFLTQYCLQPVPGGGRLFSHAQRAQLMGTHDRERAPAEGASYAAGLDLAGGDDAHAETLTPRSEGGPSPITGAGRGTGGRDATVLTIGRLVYPASGAIVQEPTVEIVEHYAWTGDPHETLLPRIIDLLRVWKVGCVAVDATGLGETTARLVAQAIGDTRVKAVKFTAPSKSQLGFDLLASANGARLKMYRSDGSPEYGEFWRQCELARAAYRANETMNFFVEERDGHDDYVVSAALLVHASRDRTRRTARGRIREQ